MKFQKQQFRHLPDQGIYGDCWRAAYASLLGLDIEEVPHFLDDNPSAETACRRVDSFLEARGLRRFVWPMTIGECELTEVLETFGRFNPGIPALLGGLSRNGCNHAVIICDGEVIWDPARDDSGIVGPCDDGFYWMEIIGRFEGAQ